MHFAVPPWLRKFFEIFGKEYFLMHTFRPEELKDAQAEEDQKRREKMKKKRKKKKKDGDRR